MPDHSASPPPPPTSPPKPPLKAFGGYEIEGELGRGGMGVVYLARQIELNRLVALKMLTGHYGSDELQRFLEEAETAAGLNHTNIAHIYEVGEHLGAPFFSMEYVEAGSIADRLRKELPSPQDAAQLLMKVARALHFAHENGVVHRDMKPANVLLDSDGVPKVADFGIAKRLKDDTKLTRSGAVIGTPTYMAPEQAKGHSRHVGPAADIYYKNRGDVVHESGCGISDKEQNQHVGATYQAYTVGGYRFICLNTNQHRPLGLSDEQCCGFAFKWTWPSRAIVQTRPIAAVFIGHTHYDQMANDGRNVYVVSRSIGDPEGGAAGYSIVHLDGEDLAVTYRTREQRGPIALITHPRRLILATRPEHIVSGPAECHARAWSAVPINSSQARIDEGPWSDMRNTGEMTWSFPITGDTLAKGEHTLEVRLIDKNKDEGTDRITFACDLSGRYTAYPMVDPVVKGTKHC